MSLSGSLQRLTRKSESYYVDQHLDYSTGRAKGRVIDKEKMVTELERRGGGRSTGPSIEAYCDTDCLN